MFITWVCTMWSLFTRCAPGVHWGVHQVCTRCAELHYQIALKTIQRVVGKLEEDLTLLPVRQTGRPTSEVTGNNVKKIKRYLEERPRRSVRDLSKQTKLSSSLKEEILDEKLLVAAKWSASLLFQGSNGVVKWDFWIPFDFEEPGTQIFSGHPTHWI